MPERGRLTDNRCGPKTNLEPFVLENLLDRNICVVLWTASESGLKDDTKRTISDDFTVGVGDVPGVARFAIRGNDFDDLAWIVYSYG